MRLLAEALHNFGPNPSEPTAITRPLERRLRAAGTISWRVPGRCSIGPLTCLVTARDRVEVGPPVRGEGRLVDRGIKVQALGRGARVQSLAV
ncbi:MAG TPA: hypothetical protein VK390_10250, partial [Propionibacteriaceae bacterium]|nr:hypothetical protein [Propionibacteriaceae bacterium]